MTDPLACRPFTRPLRLAFVAPDGTILHLQGQALYWQQDGDRWSDCRLEVVADWAVYQQIDQAAWFHLQAGLRGPRRVVSLSLTSPCDSGSVSTPAGWGN
ncbi:MAG: hypothetical protein HC910_21795 [Spirulinaceae cyanobacterium SM2_1_0]|nr:hypothetical protein [Spirulinaceae cyanobacterium SM2_1_0]